MTTITAEDSRALLEGMRWADALRQWPPVTHLRAALVREAALTAERDASLSHQPDISRRERIATAILPAVIRNLGASAQALNIEITPETEGEMFKAAVGGSIKLTDALIAALDEGGEA